MRQGRTGGSSYIGSAMIPVCHCGESIEELIVASNPFVMNAGQGIDLVIMDDKCEKCGVMINYYHDNFIVEA